jgi:hypothetical protein
MDSNSAWEARERASDLRADAQPRQDGLRQAQEMQEKLDGAA